MTIVSRIFVYLFLVILVVVTLIPVWMLIINATRSTVEIQQGISLLPSKYLISNYKILLSKGLDLPRGFLNSMTIAVLTTVITVYFAMLTAYGIVGYNFKGKKALYNTIIVLVMIPMQLSIIGFYQWMSKLGLTDSYASLILPSIASAGSVFLPSNILTRL
jgi:ABC-type sugar transport system, permease component